MMIEVLGVGHIRSQSGRIWETFVIFGVLSLGASNSIWLRSIAISYTVRQVMMSPTTIVLPEDFRTNSIIGIMKNVRYQNAIIFNFLEIIREICEIHNFDRNKLQWRETWSHSCAV